MTDVSDLPDPTVHSVEKRKPGRPSTGKALTRAQIQRDYRKRNKSNVTKNTVEALDENMALRAQLIQVMDELEAVKAKARVECELGEKARARVRELERQLAAEQKSGAKKAPPEARYELQALSELDGQWYRMGSPWIYKSKPAAMVDLKLFSEGKGTSVWRVLDRKTGNILTA